MSSKIRNCVRDLENKRNPEKRIQEYVEEYMQIQNSYAETQFMMEYYMFYEVVSEEMNPYIHQAEDIIGALHGIVEAYYEKNPSKEQIKGMEQELLSLRQSILDKMDVLAAYIDCFIVYEYILNRIQYRFDDMETMPEDSVFAQSLVEFIFSGEDSAVVSDYIRTAMGQLPVRIARSRYFEWIRNSISCYIDSDKESLDSFLYMFRTNAMMYRNEHMEEYFTEFVQVIEELAVLDYENIDCSTYRIYEEKLLANSSKLNDLSDLYMQLGELINEMYCICASAGYAGGEKQSDAGRIVIRGVNALFLSKDSDVWSLNGGSPAGTEDEKLDWLQSQLEYVEGKLEGIYTSVNTAGAVLDEITVSWEGLIESLGLREDFDTLGKLFILSSGGTFANLEKHGQGETVTGRMAEETADALILECKEFFKGKSRMLRRAVMANTMGIMPIVFQSPEEVSQYVMDSLQQCDDEAEKYAAKQILIDLMQ